MGDLDAIARELVALHAAVEAHLSSEGPCQNIDGDESSENGFCNDSECTYCAMG